MENSYAKYISTSAKKTKVVTKYGVTMMQDYLDSIGRNVSTVRLTNIMDDPAIKKNMKGVHTYNKHIEYFLHIN